MFVFTDELLMCQHHCPLPRRYLVLSWSSSSVSLSSVSCRGHSCAPGAIMDPSVTAAPLTARPFTTSNYSGAPTPDSAVHFPHIRQSLNKTKAQLSLHFWWKQNTQAPGLFILLPGSFCLVRILDVVIQRRREEIREGGGGFNVWKANTHRMIWEFWVNSQKCYWHILSLSFISFILVE